MYFTRTRLGKDEKEEDCWNYKSVTCPDLEGDGEIILYCG